MHKKKTRSERFITAVLMVILFQITLPSYAQDYVTSAEQAIAIDFDTGAVLFEKDADKQIPTASMSKVLSIYLVFEALKAGRLKLDNELLVSEKAWKMKGSKMWVPINEKVKVEDLIRGVVIQSGNDATIVLAEGLAGSEEAFATALNKKAKELGMNYSHFTNASGWPDPEHYSTPRDLALMAGSLIRDFPEYYHYYSEKEFTYHDIKQGNRNPLLYRNIGADGVKTGHTEEAGYGLIASGVQDERRVVAVLTGMKSMQERADESANLLQWALSTFKNVKIFSEQKEIERVPVVWGTVDTVGLRVAQTLVVSMPKMESGNFSVEISYKTPLIAPLEEGQNIGTATVRIAGREDLSVPLLTVSSVPKADFMSLMLQKLRMMISG
ncbi:MAG: D-alanyl-D-alanine carboxypeptidase [Alphaproteobacteria bacterium]|nr:D-alanyl-D-alanine carboxypeptidase [Alphaproteobacteria bacterium]MCB9975831.1 D-alanyl-D-alanine carboxypeptidase [Rhodospirillales bacterium]